MNRPLPTPFNNCVVPTSFNFNLFRFVLSFHGHRISVERVRKFDIAIPPTMASAVLLRNALSASVRKLKESKHKRKLVVLEPKLSKNHVNGSLVIQSDPESALGEEEGREGSTTSCPPPAPEKKAIPPIGFVTEWITAYIFLARKLSEGGSGTISYTSQR